MKMQRSASTLAIPVVLVGAVIIAIALFAMSTRAQTTTSSPSTQQNPSTSNTSGNTNGTLNNTNGTFTNSSNPQSGSSTWGTVYTNGNTSSGFQNGQQGNTTVNGSGSNNPYYWQGWVDNGQIQVSTTSTARMNAPVMPVPPDNAPAPMVVSVDSSGNALVRGVVQSVSSNYLVINTWGGSWLIRSAGATRATPEGVSGPNDLSAIMPGDFVGVMGVVAPDQVFTVNAAFVRDWTKSPSTGTASTVSNGTTGSQSTTTGSSTSGSLNNSSGGTNGTTSGSSGTSY